MPDFIKVIDSNEENFYQVENTLIQNFGYNECYWRKENDAIFVYYKDIPVIEHLI